MHAFTLRNESHSGCREINERSSTIGTSICYTVRCTASLDVTLGQCNGDNAQKERFTPLSDFLHNLRREKHTDLLHYLLNMRSFGNTFCQLARLPTPRKKWISSTFRCKIQAWLEILGAQSACLTTFNKNHKNPHHGLFKIPFLRKREMKLQQRNSRCSTERCMEDVHHLRGPLLQSVKRGAFRLSSEKDSAKCSCVSTLLTSASCSEVRTLSPQLSAPRCTPFALPGHIEDHLQGLVHDMRHGPPTVRSRLRASCGMSMIPSGISSTTTCSKRSKALSLPRGTQHGVGGAKPPSSFSPPHHHHHSSSPARSRRH